MSSMNHVRWGLPVPGRWHWSIVWSSFRGMNHLANMGALERSVSAPTVFLHIKCDERIDIWTPEGDGYG